MKIGVDLDGTFVNFSGPLLEETARRGFGEFTEKDITSYNWTDWVPGFTKEDWEDIYYKTMIRQPHFFERLQPYSKEDMDYLFSGKTNGSKQYKALRKNGDIIDIEVHSSLVSDNKGKPSGIRGIIVDVTERIKSEEKIKHLSFHDY